jgi:hypothetical protein
MLQFIDFTVIHHSPVMGKRRAVKNMDGIIIKRIAQLKKTVVVNAAKTDVAIGINYQSFKNILTN